MGANRKTWGEKLESSKGLPRVEPITEKQSRRWGRGTIVIPAPLEVDAFMRKVPAGKVVTINDVQAALARKHGATIGCPICTGIFALIAARTAAEDAARGKTRLTPYWRTLKAGGVVNEKYPGGLAGQKKLLEQEGHKVIKRRKGLVVAGYDAKLAKL